MQFDKYVEWTYKHYIIFTVVWCWEDLEPHVTLNKSQFILDHPLLQYW